MRNDVDRIAGRRQSRELTGRTVLVCLVAFFGVVFAVNAYMAYAATSTFGGVTTASSYQAGLAFGRELARADAQDARRWRVDARLTPTAGGETRIDLLARDAAGRPLGAFDPSVMLRHPADRQFDHTVAMHADGGGRFHGTVLAAAGQWDLVIELSRAGERLFRSKNRVGLR